MAVTRTQNRGGVTYPAGWAMTTAANFNPVPATSSMVQYVTPVDENGSVIAGGSTNFGTPLGYQQIVGMVAATSLTVPATATFAVIQAESVDVRWRDDGVAPTASVGMLLASGSPAPTTFSGDLAALQFIQTQATSTLNVSYYR